MSFSSSAQLYNITPPNIIIMTMLIARTRVDNDELWASCAVLRDTVVVVLVDATYFPSGTSECGRNKCGGNCVVLRIFENLPPFALLVEEVEEGSHIKRNGSQKGTTDR